MNFVYDGKPELGECGLAVVSVVERLDHSYNNIFTFDVEGRSLDPPNRCGRNILFYPLFPLVGEKLYEL
jgi:hypothetical protein